MVTKHVRDGAIRFLEHQIQVSYQQPVSPREQELRMQLRAEIGRLRELPCDPPREDISPCGQLLIKEREIENLRKGL